MILALDNYKGKVINRIVRVGVELEGAWRYQRPTNFVHDGSVKGFGTAYGDDIELDEQGKKLYVGEVPSPPLIPAQVEKWIHDNYPALNNKTCGLHVHMSFPTALHYARLMCREYHDTMIQYLKLWAFEEKFPEDHHIWDRLAGKFEHCQLEFWPDKQVRAGRKNYHRDFKGHRYTAVNYCHGLNNKQTLEIRVLPMMETAEQAVRAVHEILDITNASMVALAKREKPFEELVQAPNKLQPCIESTVESFV